MSALENILGMLPDRISSGKQDQIFTPAHIAKEMVNALPKDIWNRHTTFFDPICKSGIFLYEIYQKLMESADLIEAFPDQTSRREHIINNQLFGIAVDLMCQMMSIRSVYGYLEPNSHIILLNDYQTVMRNADKRFLIETLQKEFGTMKFDVVIGNPPYNRGMDLDFVDLGYKLSNKYTCMITPAKWQTAEADQKIASKMTYGEFRKQLVPHMSKVVFYPDCNDIFNIKIKNGISYFVLANQKVDKCLVVNKCERQKYFQSSAERDIKNMETLFNIGNEITELLSKSSKFKFPKFDNQKRYRLYCGNLITSSGGNEHFLTADGKSLVSSACKVIDTQSVWNEPSLTSNKIAYCSDDKMECDSFKSWLDTKFVRFFVLINISAFSNVMDNHYFRFVPAPPSGKFDHIYTDEELYKAFNLPQKYIDVIEAVIKERK